MRWTRVFLVLRENESMNEQLNGCQFYFNRMQHSVEIQKMSV